MTKAVNPYPKTIVDESSGVEVSNIQYEAWEEGYKAAFTESSSDETDSDGN